jgi:hypothetical protein
MNTKETLSLGAWCSTAKCSKTCQTISVKERDIEMKVCGGASAGFDDS